MSKLSYSKKVKCQGCTALHSDKSSGGLVYSCGLNVSILTQTIGRDQTKPAPLSKCYKPKNTSDYRKLRLKNKKSNAA